MKFKDVNQAARYILPLFAVLLCLHLLAGCAIAEDIEHSVIYSGENEFAGWPANEGLWRWGDEVLVGFNVTRVKQRDDYHNVDKEAYMWVNFARSTDGGETWTIEAHPEVSIPGYFAEDGYYVQRPGFKPIPDALPSPGNINFTHPDFALKARGDRFWYSYNRGHNWQGPYQLPHADKRFIKARTNYLVIDSQTAILFYEATDIPYDQGEHLRIMVMKTTDAGKTFNRIAWLTPDPLEGLEISQAKPAYACMPGVTMLDDGTMLAAVRWSIGRHKWTDLRASTDSGNTWKRRSIIFNRNNNPASLIDLGNGRVAAIYGYRNEPYGVRAKISEDAGKSWSKEFVLQDNGREWDLGYIRAALRSDGKILAIYYHTTVEHPDEFIACTIWDPPATTQPVRDLEIKDDGTIISRPTQFSMSQSGVSIDSSNPLFQHGRSDFTITGAFQTPPNEDGPNRFILDNMNSLGGFAVTIGRSDRSYKGKLYFNVMGPGKDDDKTLFSDQRVDDGRPHTFTVWVENEVMHMIVDGQTQSLTVNLGPTSTATAPPQAPTTIGGDFIGTIATLRVHPGKPDSNGGAQR